MIARPATAGQTGDDAVMDDLGQAKTVLDLRAPTVWEAELGIRILDPDGWRSGGALGPRDWDALITRAEFEQRAARSTCSQQPETMA